MKPHNYRLRSTIEQQEPPTYAISIPRYHVTVLRVTGGPTLISLVHYRSGNYNAALEAFGGLHCASGFETCL